MNFSDLINRVSFINEARVSPFAKVSPSFGNVTKELKTAGLSSAPYDTIKFIGNVLTSLGILSEDELSTVDTSKGFKAKQTALLALLDTKKEIINQRSEEIEQAVKADINEYVKRVAINRGSGRSGGRVDKYEIQKAAEELKKQTKELKKQAKSPEAAAAVEVISAGLDDASKERVTTAHETTLLHAAATKVIRDIRTNLGQEGVDIDEGALDQVEDYVFSKVDTLDKFIKFVKNISAEPGYELIAAYLADVVKPVRAALTDSKFEDEEYNASKADIDKDSSTEPWEKGLAKKRGFTESTTAEYLTEQVKKDKYNKVATENSISFKERFKPKTIWQLQEVRRYGL